MQEAQKRLDVLLVDLKLVSSREKAQNAIKAGRVLVDKKVITKPGTKVSNDSDVFIEEDSINFVSRGGFKLQKAIELFKLSLEEYVCIDFGASTGGFTDCLIQHGAKKVYAVDVGSDQLDTKLREDERVINLEKTNLRDLSEEIIHEKVDFACADLSFISLKFLFPIMNKFLKDGCLSVCLLKPQFEAGRENIGKNGIVKDKKVHMNVISSICQTATENSFSPVDITFSPIKGTKGNIEYLLLLKKKNGTNSINQNKINAVIEAAHKELNGGAKNE